MPTKSITLAPGESYVLPAGASITYISDPNSFSSVNNCAVKNIQQLNCYIMALIGSDNNQSVSNPWQADSTTLITAVNAGGVNYVIPSGSGMQQNGAFNITEIKTFIESNPILSGMVLDITTSGAVDTNNNRGAVVTMCFKTTEAIAQSFYLDLTTQLKSVAGGNNTTFATDWRVYAVPFDEYTGVGKCGCVAPSV